MPAPLYHVGATALCPHGGQVTVIPTAAPRVFLGGQPVATMGDVYPVAGCGNAPPCTTVQWIVPATRVLANGIPVLLQASVGACSGAGPQEPPAIVVTQPRVIGT